MEDRLSTFLAKTTNELGTELESLKLIFDMKQEIFFKSSAKGALAEDDIAAYLNEFFIEQSFSDRALLTGNDAGKLAKNKTGDIICKINSDENLKIVIECKFDKSVRLGEVTTKDVFLKKSDTAWSQLIEAQANRDGRVAIIVFDLSSVDGGLLNTIQNVRYISQIGFVAIVDSQKGDYRNLAIAYMLARDIAVNAHPVALDKDLLAIIMNRIIKDLGEILQIKNLVLANIDNNKKILGQLERGVLLMDFNQKYLARFLSSGTISREDLLEFYSGEEVRDRYRLIEKDLKEL